MATERVGIEIEILGYKEALSQMQNLERAMKGLQGIKMRMDVGKRLKALKQNMASLRAEAEHLKASMADSTKGSAEWTKDAARLKQVRREMSQTAAEAQRLNQIMRSTSSVGQMFKRNTTAVAHLGSAMQSAGNAMQRFLAPWRLLTGGALLGAGYSAINKMTEGLTSGFERYDVMTKYNRMMKSFEKGNYTAQKSIEQLDKSVQGLPTSLDEMVSLAQRFTMTTGDMRKGTQLAIATNNAFMASMSTETQRYQGMMQLQDVLGGKKMGAKEWQSLANSMMPAIRMMGEDLGKSGKELDEWVAAVQQGKVSNEEFLKALEKTGTGAGKAAKMAEEAKNTWEAFSARIGTAFSRMTYGALQAFDEIVSTLGLVDKDGKAIKTLNQLLDDRVIGGINRMAKSLQNWIKANPDKIVDFFNALKGVDWAGFGKGFIKGLGQIANLIQRAAKSLNGKNLEGLGNFFSKLLWLAPTLTIGGGLLKGGRHILGGLVTGLELLVGTIGGLEVGMATTNAGKLVTLFKTLGKAKKASGAIAGAEAVAGAGGKLGAGAIAKGFGPALAVIGGIGAVVTEITGIAAINTWIINKGIENLIGITDGIKQVIKNVNKIKDTDFDKEALKSAVSTITDIYNTLYGGGEGKQVTRGANKAGTSLLGGEKGFGDMSPSKLKKSSDAIGYMFDMFKSVGSVLKKMPQLIKNRGDVNMDTFMNIFGGENGIFAQFGKIAQDVDKYIGEDTKIEGIAEKMGQFKSILTSVSEIGKMIPALTKTLSKSAGTQQGRGATPLTMLKQMLTGENGLFAVFGGIMDSMEMDMLGGSNNKRGNLKDITKFSEAMGQIKTMFDSLQQVIDMFPTLQSSLGALRNQGSGRGSILGTVKQQITQLFTDLGQMFTAFDASIGSYFNMDKIVADVDKAVTAVKSLGKIATQLSSLGTGELASSDGAAFTAIDNIKTMVTKLGQSINTETVSQLQEQVDAFKTSVQGIFDALNGDLANVEVTVNIKGKVTGYKELIAEIKSANSAIRSAVRGITNSYTRHVYIHIQRHVNVTGDTVPSDSELNSHTGGLVPAHGTTPLYRSKGGNIFKPKGTDTVPAMLTPGEYVQSKKAVDFFGVRFMQKLNHLDVKGAMRELSARVGANSVMARGMTVYNNITNNNQTVNQNVRTNNPNFAFRRSRYIAAL